MTDAVTTAGATSLAIDAIIQDPSVWPRAGYDPEAIARYQHVVDQLPPVRIARTSHILLDGFHRLKALKDAGWDTVSVIVEDCAPDRYLARALQLNTHGVSLPIERRDAVIVRLSQEGVTQAEIATCAGISQGRVAQILATYTRDRPADEVMSEAIAMVNAGQSLRKTERTTGIPRSTLERALRDATQRQILIRKHHQSSGGLASLVRYPDRGPWGKASYFGNCPGYLLVDLLTYFTPHSVFDPMEGSGTTGDVCADLGIAYQGGDLQHGYDLLSSPLPDQSFDLIFWHPPYWPGHRYTKHPNDFSMARNVDEFLVRMNEGFIRLATRLNPRGHLVLLIGDGRKNGRFYPVHSNIIGWNILPLDAVLIKYGKHHRRERHIQ